MTASTTTPRRPPMDARIRERRIQVRQARLRRRRRVVGSVIVVALLGGAAFGVTRSPLFAISGVRVEGVEGDHARLVREVAQVRSGQNLMTANLDGAVARTRALPWVASAQVRRVPPATVVLEVEPRRPIGILDSTSGQWLVDTTGVVVARAAGEQLPHITLTTNAVPVPGSPIDDLAAHNALALHEALPRDVRGALLAVEAVGVRTVRVQLDLHLLTDPANYPKGATTWVRLGAAGDVEQQVLVLRALLAQLRETHAGVPSEIDVRVPDNPSVTP
jgi:cell division protein FtsQ